MKYKEKKNNEIFMYVVFALPFFTVSTFLPNENILQNLPWDYNNFIHLHISKNIFGAFFFHSWFMMSTRFHLFDTSYYDHNNYQMLWDFRFSTAETDDFAGLRHCLRPVNYVILFCHRLKVTRLKFENVYKLIFGGANVRF